MKQTKVVLITSGIILFIYFIVLYIMEFKGYISNLQLFISIPILPFLFWIVLILATMRILFADIGFLKIGAALAVALGFMMIVTMFTTQEYSYERLQNDEYTLIIEHQKVFSGGSYAKDLVIIYRKDNVFFSKEIGTTLVALNYHTKYSIIGNNVVINKCTDNTCITDLVPID